MSIECVGTFIYTLILIIMHDNYHNINKLISYYNYYSDLISFHFNTLSPVADFPGLYLHA